MQEIVTFFYEHDLMIAFFFAFVWELTFKMLAMWRAARNNDLGWFIALGVVNSIGILSIFYLIKHRKPLQKA